MRFLPILLIIFLFACETTSGIDDPNKRNENWCWFVDEKTGEGKWVSVGDSTNLPNGDYTLFFCNGKIRQKGKIKDHRDCDTIYYYDLEEKLISKLLYLPDSTLQEFMPDGKYISYYSTCEKSGEGEFRNNKQVGTRIEYYKNGKMKFKSIVLNDTFWIMNYYESGQIKDSTKQINKMYEGVAVSWYENGQVAFQRTYKNGLEHGPAISYFENGQIDQKASYSFGQPNDTITDWYENGKMKAVRYYVNGKKQGHFLAWFDTGQLQAESNFLDDNKHGQYKEYHSNGKLAKEGNYVNGQKSGVWKYYDEQGNLIDAK